MSHPVSQLHSSNPALDRLERLVAEVGDLQSKLILLAGNGGKTKLLRSLGERLQSLPVNVGVKLGQRLAATPVSERGFSANELLRDITVSARSNAPLLLDNLEVLFEPSPWAAARWISSDDRAKLDAFLDSNRSAAAKDLDGAPVYLAKNAWDVGYVSEKNPAIRFTKTKERV